jgi:arylformamidase
LLGTHQEFRLASPVFAHYTQEELDAQYDNQRACPTFRDTLARGALLGTEAAGLPGERNVRWGTHPQECLDIYRPAAGDRLPVVVYVHGGAWLTLDKEDSAFAAQAFVDTGCMLVALGFPDVTDVSFAHMVSSVRSAVAWIHGNIERFGGDPARIVLIGHSSGTHLVSQCLTHDWSAAGLPVVPFHGALMVSGLCDLEPARLSYRNKRLNLSPDDVLEYSLIHKHPAPVPVAVAVAQNDTDEFRRQSRAMADYLDSFGLLTSFEQIEGRHHFDVILDLCDQASTLHRAVLALLDRASLTTTEVTVR